MTKQRTTPTTKTTNTGTPDAPEQFLFDKTNYIWMLGGVVLVLIGFMLMSGGKSEDPTKFNYDEIYSVTRITVAPLLILIGFGIEVYAIMKKPAKSTVAY